MAFCISVCWYPQVSPEELAWLWQHCKFLKSVSPCSSPCLLYSERQPASGIAWLLQCSDRNCNFLLWERSTL